MSLLEKGLHSPALKAFLHALEKRDPLLIEELWQTPKAFLAALARKVTGSHLLIITSHSEEEGGLFHDLQFFTDSKCIDFPSWETLPNENIPPSPDIVGDRYRTLEVLLTEKTPQIILTNLQACLQKVLPPQRLKQLHVSVAKGAVIDFEGLVMQLDQMGYTRTPIVADKGEYAVRGGIIDVYSVAAPEPFRIEFWGDEVESIRLFDPIGQRTIRPVEMFSIPPAQELEMLNSGEDLATILDYLGNDTIVIFDDLAHLEDHYATLLRLIGKNIETFCSFDLFFEKVRRCQTIFWTKQVIEELCPIQKQEDKIYFEMFQKQLSALRWQSPFLTVEEALLPQGTLLEALPSLPKETEVYFICTSESDEIQLKKQLLNLSLPKHVHTLMGYLSSGFFLADSEWLLFPTTELTHQTKIRRQKQRGTYHGTPIEVHEFAVGEMVVHAQNGIGRFMGIEQKTDHEGNNREFLVLEYAKGAKLFVPMAQAHFVSKYIGASEESPTLHLLGSKKWQRTLANTQKAIDGYAKELLKTYAEREVYRKTPYPADTDEMKRFEEEFPFIETEDQLSAINAIKDDLMGKQSMDRLVCGDVGYGKTEVAMRSAFKAVIEAGKQVAVLVPTTVLAMQHWENFIERMNRFPIRIDVLSRFRKPKQIRQTLEDLTKGTVDIVIGTHRVVSKDVQFKDLGLVIIDEEQRFGVKAKEHLKTIKTGVNCLTLSATPIPRTLYLSLVGARDMSLINTPPQDRLPIKTIITEGTDEIFKTALTRELTRGGQSFIIHNRVETIFTFATRIQKLVPQARIVVGHGQMSADEIDTIFHKFKRGQADILISTTIVENGIDIPNANTILVDRADRFGLADLYQLRGRVGRWNRRAFAYFLVPNLHTLPAITRKRMNALAEASGYGGGMKVAMRDLEIRGAGDILGTEQSGQVATVGFHLYCKMLKRTIARLQGKLPATLVDTKIELPIDARIPDTFLPELTLRLEVYQRLGEALTPEEVHAIAEELRDRFGPPPEPLQWLFSLAHLRTTASHQGITLIKMQRRSLLIEQFKGKKKVEHQRFYTIPKEPHLLTSSILEVSSG